MKKLSIANINSLLDEMIGDLLDLSIDNPQHNFTPRIEQLENVKERINSLSEDDGWIPVIEDFFNKSHFSSYETHSWFSLNPV